MLSCLRKAISAENKNQKKVTMLIRSTYAVIDLNAVKQNVKNIKSRLPESTMLCAVVKADAYGHGSAMVSKAALEAGAAWLAVAIPEEAAVLREEGITAPILVLGPSNKWQWEMAAELGLSMNVSSKECVMYALEAAKKYGKRVVNVPTANTNSVAEHAFALILACAKNIPFTVKEYQNNNFSIKNKVSCMEVSGKTLGLIGLGRIGSSVAKMAKYGFNMNVLAYDPYIPKDRVIEGVCLTDSWERVFKESDFISVHMPANKQTAKCISTREFELMKKSAYIINAARGQIIDEVALVKALKEGRIAGAGLDVSDPEPANMDNPLLKMSNVIMTPHIAGSTQEALVRMAVGAAMGIDEILTDKEPQWLVV
jgi:D-3-phosphoglycerate dehydrogenase